MPLGKLQRPADYDAVGAADYPRFVYDDAPFHEQVTARQLHARPLSVVLQPEVPDRLVGLAGLLRPLLELHWTRAVAGFNHTDFAEDRLRNFLFGADRIVLKDVRDGLRDAQDGRCFSCRDPLRVGAVQVDHFVPWSRVPNDALGNLVLADSACNGSKRDHFADLALLERWAAPTHGRLAPGVGGAQLAARARAVAAAGSRALRPPDGRRAAVAGARCLHPARPRPTGRRPAPARPVVSAFAQRGPRFRTCHRRRP